ncbi:hypothetical protein HGG64_02480 [Mycoplasma phocoeninasale]|uniref:Uncharacterized protein n=1 Tax=Mycoplasma phocoeninasale TaxID=2726117 RepID=A0A858U757_9MOLU|nr:hypothetical protein [Mycoplasma phocoeninasale]QJG66556.1 hypothetical protein HGG64_02480 [Mycoplasma phocoeninasale]
MKKKTKKILDKYYISEAFDKNRNISFNFKKANKKISGNFAEFTDALAEYVRVAEQSENETRVWFHRDAAYRGSVGLEKARLIIDHVKEKNVDNQQVIDYIEKENLVEKPVKKPSKKMMVAEELEKEANEISFDVQDKESKMSSDVTSNDVEYESKFDVTILDLKPYEGKLDVYYNLSSEDGQTSETMMKTIEGFSTMMNDDMMMSENSSTMNEEPMMNEEDQKMDNDSMMMNEDNQMMEEENKDMMMSDEGHSHHHHSKHYNPKNTGIKVALSLLIIIALVNLVLLILNITEIL